MGSSRTTRMAMQLDIAKELLSRGHLDLKATLAMLKALPADIGEDAQASVREALRDVQAATRRKASQEALARFALARVVTMLERDLRASAAPKVAASRVLEFEPLDLPAGGMGRKTMSR